MGGGGAAPYLSAAAHGAPAFAAKEQPMSTTANCHTAVATALSIRSAALADRLERNATALADFALQRGEAGAGLEGRWHMRWLGEK